MSESIAGLFLLLWAGAILHSLVLISNPVRAGFLLFMLAFACNSCYSREESISVWTDGQSYKIGDTVEIKWEAANIPAGAELRLFVYPDFQYYQNPTLDVFESEIKVTSGKGSFKWNSSKAWVRSPYDVARGAVRPEPGKYGIGAIVQGRTPVSKQAFNIAEGHGESFYLSGEPKNLKTLETAMDFAARRMFDPLKLHDWSETKLEERYIQMASMQKNSDGSYSKSYTLLEPFQGVLKIKAQDTATLSIDGKVSFAPSVLSYDKAKAIAEKAIRDKFGPRARPELGTSISVHLHHWVYKKSTPTSPAHWNLEMQAVEVGGSSYLKDRLTGNRLYLRVFNNGKCQMKEAEIDKETGRPKWLDIWTDNF